MHVNICHDRGSTQKYYIKSIYFHYLDILALSYSLNIWPNDREFYILAIITIEINFSQINMEVAKKIFQIWYVLQYGNIGPALGPEPLTTQGPWISQWGRYFLYSITIH